MKRKTTLLVGLDNPHGDRPALALFPREVDGIGNRIMGLIREQVGKYTSAEYLEDFHRVNMHPNGRAPEGHRRGQRDKDAFGMVRVLADILDVDDVVMFGARVCMAYEKTFDLETQWFRCQVPERTALRRWWAVPTPSPKSRFYTDERRRAKAGKLLVRLRRNAQDTRSEVTQ